MTAAARKTCAWSWPGQAPAFLPPHPDVQHHCTRPPGHPGNHHCACSAMTTNDERNRP